MVKSRDLDCVGRRCDIRDWISVEGEDEVRARFSREGVRAHYSKGQLVAGGGRSTSSSRTFLLSLGSQPLVEIISD
jgi:hypothetical protein